MKNFIKFILVSFIWAITVLLFVVAYVDGSTLMQGLSIAFLLLSIVSTAYAITEK